MRLSCISLQYFYDFALRALKAALVTAGSLRSAALDVPEELILMRALRDMNIPKLVRQDLPLFLGLLGDLFPGVLCPVAGRSDLKTAIEEVVLCTGPPLREGRTPTLMYCDPDKRLCSLFWGWA